MANITIIGSASNKMGDYGAGAEYLTYWWQDQRRRGLINFEWAAGDTSLTDTRR